MNARSDSRRAARVYFRSVPDFIKVCRTLAAAAIAASIPAACSSVVQGQPALPPGAGGVAVELLDAGNYPVKPRPALGAAGTATAGRSIDAARMASFMAAPWDVDPTLVQNGGAAILRNPSALSAVTAHTDEVTDAIGRHDFIYAFQVVRGGPNETKKAVRSTVARFADPSAASSAATDIYTAALNSVFKFLPDRPGDPPAPVYPKIPTSIPGHPEAKAFTQDFTASQGRWEVNSYLAQGPYVLIVSVNALDSASAVALAGQIMDKQGPQIDQFQPSDPARFAELPIDPTGLLARVLPVSDDDRVVTQRKTYDARGWLLFDSAPIQTNALFSDPAVSVDLVAVEGATVYRAKDSAGAVKLLQGFVDEVGKEQPPQKPVERVQFLTSSRCFEIGDATMFHCLASYDRYLIETSGKFLRDVQQKIGAQVRLLAAN
ncbi:Uncharacterised protein [Mycobacteroides abscessus subsp. abscessus]|nr:Uncharacterised protein [Mycobacteroides abscessus subsp. abscessus]